MFRTVSRHHLGVLGRTRGSLVGVTFTLLLVMSVVGGLGCGGEDGSADVGQTTISVEDGQVGDGQTTTSYLGDKTGGTLRVGSQPAINLDPHFSTSVADIMLNHQVYDWLVEIDENNKPVPGLAESWEHSEDGMEWTFALRQGVKFHDGSELGSEDVVYTFDRLRDPDVGTPTANLYENIKSVEAVDSTHVRFSLTAPNPEFPIDAGDYHAAVLSSDVKDPVKNWVGTGPFMIESFLPEDRAELARNPDYWREGADGQSLPYLEGINIIFSPDQGAQMEALRGGELDYVGGLTKVLADTVSADSGLELLTVNSNMHYVIHMRSDEGHVAADNRVRMALKLGTEQQAIVDLVRPGLADPGNGTPVGPTYGEYYLDEPPQYDPEKARQLLAEAGYGDGLDITLHAQTALDVPDIATVWKQQMANIGVNVDIQTVPPEVYYGGEGDADWMQVDFGITEWGARATAVTYFQLAYSSNGQYNESHWSDRVFDRITRQITGELDPQKRIQLYHEAQQILRERGPVIVPYMQAAAAGVNKEVQGIDLATDWPRTFFRSAYFSR